MDAKPILNLGLRLGEGTGALRVGSGIITQGAVVALYNYMSQILIELIKLANLIITITKAGASANRIADLLDIKSSMDVAADFESFNDEEPAVEFDGVSLKYTGAKEEAIKELTFTLKRGDTLGIIGATGSGKSSLINLIPRFYDATEGEVRVMGANVKNCDLHELRSIIGIVPQKAVLFKGSLRDNMLWGDDSATDEDIWQALRMAQAEDFVKSKGEGLEFMIEQGGRNLSGGQKQRLTIARALLKKPAVLILDDSASALDYRTDLMLRKAISDIEYDPAVIIVSQRTSSLMHAREIIVMDDGEMAAKGTHEELMENCRLYKEIYDSQFSKEAVS